jgi:hypothetical protein
VEHISMQDPRARSRYMRYVKERCGGATRLIFILNHHVAGLLHWSFAVVYLDYQVIEHYDSFRPMETEAGVYYELLLIGVADANSDCSQFARVRDRRRNAVLPRPPSAAQWWIEPLLQVCAYLRPASAAEAIRVCKPASYFRQLDGSSCGIYTLLGVILLTRGAHWN